MAKKAKEQKERNELKDLLDLHSSQQAELHDMQLKLSRFMTKGAPLPKESELMDKEARCGLPKSIVIRKIILVNFCP